MRGVQVVTAAVAATCLVASMPAVAADAAAGVDVASAYIFRGATVLDEVVVQPYLEGAFYGVTVGTWANFNTDSSQFDEIDYYASYELPLGEAAPVGVTIGYTEYTYPTAVDELGAGLEADREASIGASLAAPLSPSLTAYYGIEGPFLDEGLYLELGLGHDIEVTDKMMLSGSAAIGYEAGDNVADEGLSHVTLGLSAGFGPLTASIYYVVETDDDVLVVDEDVYGSVGISLPL